MATIHQEPAVLELWELLQRCLGKSDLAKRVLTRFKSQLQNDLAGISQALRAGEFETAREIAHRLKGAAANVAAHALQEQAHSLECALQMEMSDQYDLVYRGLLSEQQRFEAAFEQAGI